MDRADQECSGGIVAFVPDLMDRSKVAAAAPGTRFVPRVEGLLGASAGARLVVVDLSRTGALEAVSDLTALGVDTVGFVSHVDRQLMMAAKAAGCTRVLARSAFFAGLAELLAG